MLVFDDLRVPGKLATPSFLKFQTCEKSNLVWRDTDLQTGAVRVFFHAREPFSDQDSGQTREALGNPRVACCS